MKIGEITPCFYVDRNHPLERKNIIIQEKGENYEEITLSREDVIHYLATKSMTHRQAALAAPKNWVEMQTLRFYLGVLNQNLHSNKISGGSWHLQGY